MLVYLLFIIGIVLLIKSADWLIDGASALSARWGVPPLVVGLTVVSFGTSMPEFVVSILGAFSGETGIALGNVVGSNLANILLILGLTALIYPPQLKRSTVWKEIPFSLLAALTLLVISNDQLIDHLGISALSRIDGLVLLFFFVIFIYYVFEAARQKQGEVAESNVSADLSNNRLALLLLVGVIGLYLGGRWTVEGAVAIAQTLGVSSFLIAATVIAVGTSLPELVTSFRAAIRKNADIAVGNIVGSNIFNIFWILGATALVAPVKVPLAINLDLTFLVLATFLLFLFMFIGERHKLERWQGSLFFLLYVGYLIFAVGRG